MALYISALLSFPAGWKYKFAGFFGGIAILFTLNIVRIVSLFLTRVYFPIFFEIMHVDVWQAGFVIFAISLLACWLIWVIKRDYNVA